MVMDVTAGKKAGFNRAVWGSLAMVAALVLAGCGGGGNSNSGQGPQLSSSIGATPTAMSEPNGPAPLAVTFMAMEPKGAIAKYEWDFKDNSAVVNGPSAEHTFNDPGQYTVTLTVKDAAGNFNRASVMVSVSEGGTCGIQCRVYSLREGAHRGIPRGDGCVQPRFRVPDALLGEGTVTRCLAGDLARLLGLF